MSQRQFGPSNGGPIHLQNCDLESAELRHSTLSGANLKRTNLVAADLVHARLEGANLSGADLTDAVLDYADLTGANLDGAIVIGASFANVRGLTEEQIAGAHGDASTVLPALLLPPEHWYPPLDDSIFNEYIEPPPIQETDPYEVLGVSRTATFDEIRTAFRNLVKKVHPDLNPDDVEAQETFKRVSIAYRILSNADQRGRYDRGEISGDGDINPDYEAQRQFRRYAFRFYAAAAGSLLLVAGVLVSIWYSILVSNDSGEGRLEIVVTPPPKQDERLVAPPASPVIMAPELPTEAREAAVEKAAAEEDEPAQDAPSDSPMSEAIAAADESPLEFTTPSENAATTEDIANVPERNPEQKERVAAKNADDQLATLIPVNGADGGTAPASDSTEVAAITPQDTSEAPAVAERPSLTPEEQPESRVAAAETPHEDNPVLGASQTDASTVSEVDSGEAPESNSAEVAPITLQDTSKAPAVEERPSLAPEERPESQVTAAETPHEDNAVLDTSQTAPSTVEDAANAVGDKLASLIDGANAASAGNASVDVTDPSSPLPVEESQTTVVAEHSPNNDPAQLALRTEDVGAPAPFKEDKQQEVILSSEPEPAASAARSETPPAHNQQNTQDLVADSIKVSSTAFERSPHNNLLLRRTKAKNLVNDPISSLFRNRAIKNALMKNDTQATASVGSPRASADTGGPEEIWDLYTHSLPDQNSVDQRAWPKILETKKRRKTRAPPAPSTKAVPVNLTTKKVRANSEPQTEHAIRERAVSDILAGGL